MGPRINAPPRAVSPRVRRCQRSCRWLRNCADVARAGIDGLLVVDLPPEEAQELARPARAAALDIIYLLAPTTPLERSRVIARSASGFLYYVSVAGVTGARTDLAHDLPANVRE